MSIDTAETIAGIPGLYFGVGAISAILFFGLAPGRVDPAARGFMGNAPLSPARRHGPQSAAEMVHRSFSQIREIDS